jgi:hypothetical protein
MGGTKMQNEKQKPENITITEGKTLSLEDFKKVIDIIDSNIITKNNEKLHNSIKLAYEIYDCGEEKENYSKVDKFSQNNDTGKVLISFRREFINRIVAQIYNIKNINEFILYVVDNKKAQAYNIWVGDIIAKHKTLLIKA